VTTDVPTQGDPMPLHEPRVLVVDDDPYIRDVVAQLLEGEGYRIEEATNGAEALGVVNDAARRPNVILLDLMMPVMDGWEFARRLQEHTPPLNIPILVLSAARLPTERLTVLGARAVLAKPFDVDELLDQVARLVEGAVGGGATGTPGAWAPGF
jgi:two-component system, chemotaxis family, chemotaxis protein CheY